MRPRISKKARRWKTRGEKFNLPNSQCTNVSWWNKNHRREIRGGWGCIKWVERVLFFHVRAFPIRWLISFILAGDWLCVPHRLGVPWPGRPHRAGLTSEPWRVATANYTLPGRRGAAVRIPEEPVPVMIGKRFKPSLLLISQLESLDFVSRQVARVALSILCVLPFVKS